MSIQNRTVYICVFLLVIVNAGVLKNKLYKLDIVHYNDFHDSFEETSVKYPQCKTNDSKCLGGFPRLFYAITSLMKSKPNALLLNAGDVFQGTYWYTFFKWNITHKFINMLPNDAHALGNHEFDDGIEGLVPYLASLKAPMVVANMDASDEPSFNGLYVPHIVVERNGRKIGIIGITTTNIKFSAKARNIKFLDPIPVIRKEAALLSEQGVNIIIVLSHCGLNSDKYFAKSVGDNVDIIVGGHSHSLLWNTKPSPTKEEIQGPYPIVIESESKPGHKVLIVTASAFTKYLGNLTVYFDDEGEVVFFEGEPVFLNRSVPEDPEIKALIQIHADELADTVNEVIGYTNDDLVFDNCSYEECTIGNFFADAYLNATKEAISSEIPKVAFILKNMIKGSLEKGIIRRGALINSSPFEYKMVTFILQGRYLVQALEQCLAMYWSRDPFKGPWIPQVAGMQVTLNTTTMRAQSVDIRNGNNVEPLDPDKDYFVTTIDTLFRGANGFQMLTEHGRDPKLLGVDREILEKYIRKTSPITSYLDKRLIMVK